MNMPAPYDKLPTEFQKTLHNSYLAVAKTWIGLSLADYLKHRENDGHMDVYKAVYLRCRVLTQLWPLITVIKGGWTYAQGHQVSQGFHFECSQPDVLLAAMKATHLFCMDKDNVHGARDTFRELIKSGPGLHVCVVQPAERGKLLHDIHIDKHQVVCRKQINGYCEYFTTRNTVEHLKTSVPWAIKEKLGLN